MEDLLEELLNVLAPPSSTESTHKEASSTYQPTPTNEAAAQKTQTNGFLASQKMASETARRATEKTEKMSPQTARQLDQEAEPDISDPAVDHGPSTGSSAGPPTLMTVASLSNLAFDQLLKAAQSLETLADNSRDVAVESLLFDAGVAVPKALGHQVFSTTEGQVRKASFEIDEDALQDPMGSANGHASTAAVKNGKGATEEDMPLPDEPLAAEPLAAEPLAAEPLANPFLEDTVLLEHGASEQISSEGLDAEHQVIEDSEAEIDESVISAFDIGDFEADAHITEEAEENDFAADNFGFSFADFDRDDPDVDHLSLEASDFGAEEALESHRENDFYEADERLETADISLNELVSATEKNFLARWFKRLVGAKADDLEEAASDPSEPRLFESNYSQSHTQTYTQSHTQNYSQSANQGKSAANYDANYDTDFYTQEALDLNLASVLEPVLEPSESLELDEEADTPDAPDTSLEPALTDDLIREDEAREGAVDVAIEAVVEANAFDLDIFEPDVLDSLEDDFDADSLLEPLGEKAWLNEADNAIEALHEAAAVGDLSGVWAALEANASVNALGRSQRTALSIAVEAGCVPVVEMLLEMCADPNVADIVNGAPVRYPLMVAATEAAESVRGDLLRLLLARGAEVNQADVMGQTALMGAAERGHVDAMRLLIEANADLDAQDLLGQTAMLRAKGQGHEGAIALLNEASMDRERAIAFLRAVTQGDLIAVKQWLAAGMSANTRVARMSALTQAAAKGEVAIARLLIEAGADIDYRFYETDPTPLFHAAYRGQLEMVILLLATGASPRPTPNYPIGALDYAEIGRQNADDATAFEPIVALLATLTRRSD